MGLQGICARRELQRVVIGAKPAISPYNSRPCALNSSCETFTGLWKIFKGYSAAGGATIALGRYKGSSYRVI
jgi:hypothetical protein